MTSTFTTLTGSVSFIATTEGWSEEARAEVNVLGFPGGDAVAISLGGQRETRRAFRAVFDSVADYRTFRDMRARAGWLLVENWDDASVQAVLISVKPDPPWMSGEVTATAQFVVY